VIVDGSPSLLPRAWTLSSASSPQAPEMRLLLPSSLVQMRGVQIAWQEERHRRPSPGADDHNIILQHLVNSQNNLRPILRQNLRDVLGQSYDTYYYNYDTFDMSYGINNS